MGLDQMIGTISMFAGNFAPRGYALCQGQLLPIAQNTALFSILGTTYGGDGRVTFALPDLRGRTPDGTGQGPGLSDIELGEQAGTETVTLILQNLPAHNHSINCDNTGATALAPGSNIPGLSDNRNAEVNIYSAGPPNATMKPVTCGAAGGSQPFGNRNPYLGINFIICMEGVFPSRN